MKNYTVEDYQNAISFIKKYAKPIYQFKGSTETLQQLVDLHKMQGKKDFEEIQYGTGVLLDGYDEEVKYWELYNLCEEDDIAVLIALDDRDDSWHYLIFDDCAGTVYDKIITEKIAKNLIIEYGDKE